MKLCIVNNSRMPTEKAHGFQIAKMCESFALKGIEVELIVPKRSNKITDNVYDYYSIKDNFVVTYLNSFDYFCLQRILGPKISFYLQSLSFQRKVKNFKFHSGSVVLTRNPELVEPLKRKGLKVFFDAHRWPESKNGIFKKMLTNCDGVICNSSGTEQEYKLNGFSNTLVAPNGVSLSDYDPKLDRKKIRNILGLPVDKKIAMYVGHLYAWKGVDVVMEAAKNSKREDLVFVFVGGLEKDVAKYKKQAVLSGLTNVLFCGHRRKDEIPKFQMAADALLLPNIPINQESDRYTSPIKMFEYMASGVPIIASSLPSIREVLNENNAVLVRTADFSAINEAVEALLGDRPLAERIAEKAKEEVKGYSWEKKAERIIDFIAK